MNNLDQDKSKDTADKRAEEGAITGGKDTDKVGDSDNAGGKTSMTAENTSGDKPSEETDAVGQSGDNSGDSEATPSGGKLDASDDALGSGAAGSGAAGSGVDGSGAAGSGVDGSGVDGSGVDGSGAEGAAGGDACVGEGKAGGKESESADKAAAAGRRKASISITNLLIQS